MRILLSGGSGLVGSAVSRSVQEDGHDIVRLVRSRPENRPENRTGSRPKDEDAAGSSNGAASVQWDTSAGTLDHEALADHGPYDAVVHLAGAPLGDGRWTPERKRVITESRIRATRLLVDALATLPTRPPVLVSASAVGWYGDRGDEILTEESKRGSGFLAELTQGWEAQAHRAAEWARVVRVRSGIVLSPTGGALGRQLPLFRLGVGGRLGNGRQFVSWITLRDEVAVIRRAIDDDRLIGALNATAPHPVTNAAFTSALGRAVHRPALLAVPRSALAVAFGEEMVREMLLASQRVQPAALTNLDHSFLDPELESALEHLLTAG
jgi:hypothetical protein